MAPDLLHLRIGRQQGVQRARGVHATILEDYDAVCLPELQVR